MSNKIISLTISTLTVVSVMVPAVFADEAKQSQNPTKLYGRIEQIAGEHGAQFPLKLKALTPKLDTSLNKQLHGGAATGLSGGAVASFPSDFRGAWQGILTVFASEYSPGRFRFDPKEAAKEQQLTAPGTQGSVTFNFEEQSPGKIVMEPTQITFSARMDADQVQQVAKQMQATSPELKALFGSIGNTDISKTPGLSALISAMPYLYQLNLGPINGGMGVTGNTLNTQVLKNEIRRLTPTVLEEQIVTAEHVANTESGRVRNEYGETVVRFYKQSENQLYVQAASVGYDAQGAFEDKVVLYGTVQRAQPQYAPPP